MESALHQRALVLDDDRAVVDTICALVSRIGLEAEGETEADAFLSRAAAWAPDFLFLDLLMPERDGVEIIRTLAAQGCRASLVLISGLGSTVLDAARRTALERGLTVAGTVAKPITRDNLRQALNTAPSGPSGITSVGHDPALTVVDLQRALDRDEIRLAYQPQIRCSNGALVGFEALARWHHPERGLIMPGRFIALAEHSGLIAPLTERIVLRGLEFVAESLTNPAIGLSINLSMMTLGDLTFADRVLARCMKFGIAPERITFELTETGAMTDAASTLDLLTRLRMKGFRLSIDDFGTGYSSMVQLVRLPFSEMKIDRSFVSSARDSRESQEVIRSMVALGSALGLDIVAEGIEDSTMLTHVASLGCDRAQGYHISRPLHAADIARWTAARTASEGRVRTGPMTMTAF